MVARRAQRVGGVRGVTAAPALAALLWLAFSCASTGDPGSGDLARDLVHRDPRVRVRAIVLAEARGRLDLADLLIDNLSHPEAPVRMVASVALERLTGHDFGYRATARPHERARAVARWKAWWDEEGRPAARASSGASSDGSSAVVPEADPAGIADRGR